MKPASRFVPLLVLIMILALSAGCTTQAEPRDTVPSPAITAPAPEPALAKSPLTTYAITRDDIAFPVNTEMASIPGKSDIPASVGKYGVTRVYVVEFYEDSEIAKTARGFRQIICEIPEANATTAFADVRTMLTKESAASKLQREIVQGPDMQIGDETVAFALRYNTTATPQYPDTVIAFRKGSIVEIITMKSAEPDFPGLQVLAEKAVSKVP